jgi:hypothetical protein
LRENLLVQGDGGLAEEEQAGGQQVQPEDAQVHWPAQEHHNILVQEGVAGIQEGRCLNQARRTGRSKLLTGMTIPKAELKAVVASATTAAMVRRNLGDRYGSATFCTDSTICLYTGLHRMTARSKRVSGRR